jgi:hypothetical protein
MIKNLKMKNRILNKMGIFTAVCLLGIIQAGTNLSGVVEISYDSNAGKFTAEDSMINYSAELKDGVSAEIVWKNNALDGYSLNYALNDSLSFHGGLIGVPFGEYYTHTVSDPLLKGDFDLTLAGIGFNYNIGNLEISGGAYNNSSPTTNANTYAVRSQINIVDGIIVGISYLKDGSKDSAVGAFTEVGLYGFIVDGEYVTKKDDNYLAIGIAYPLTDVLEIAIRIEQTKDGNTDKKATVIGGSYAITDGLTILAEYNSTNSGTGLVNSLLAKASVEF